MKGLIIKEKNGGFSKTYSYDSKNRIKKITSKMLNGGIRHSTVKFSYDKKGRLKKIDSAGSHGSNTYTMFKNAGMLLKWKSEQFVHLPLKSG